MKLQHLVTPALMALALVACGQDSPSGAEPAANVAPAEPPTIDVSRVARDAYVYGFPLVMNLKTLYDYVVNEDSPDYKGPFNEVSCEARLFTPADTAVVTPNSDTPYCMFWMDLRREPLVLSVPEIESDRYYSIQLVDLYTHNYAYIGTRTTGSEAGRYLLAGPEWSGAVPDGVGEVFRGETDFVFAVIRVQLFGPDDIGRVSEIQAGFDLQPLSGFLGEAAPAAVSDIVFPAWEPGAERSLEAFEYLDFALRLTEPRPDDAVLREQLAAIGMGDGAPFKSAALDPDTAAEMTAGLKQALADMSAFVEANASDPLFSNRLFGTRAFLDETAADMGLPDLRMLRAVGAMTGLYGNSGAEALYPTFLVDSDGDPLDASKHDYVMRFAPGDLPPAKSFWSLSMYDGKTQLFIDNPLDRYLLNSSMVADFVEEPDGDIVFYLQAEAPPEPLTANWLPAPDGPFYAVMRLYLPEDEVLEGRWTPPYIEKADDS
jgi:hypothetical protein